METERKLISDYQQYVRRVVLALRTGLGYYDLLEAYHQRKIPKEGVINGIEYSFHGVGCLGIVDGLEVDFDFGPDERIDGFDAWRLWHFAEQQPEAYPQFQRKEDVKAALERLARSGEIECPGAYPSPHLWYLKPS